MATYLQSFCAKVRASGRVDIIVGGTRNRIYDACQHSLCDRWPYISSLSRDSFDPLGEVGGGLLRELRTVSYTVIANIEEMQ